MTASVLPPGDLEALALAAARLSQRQIAARLGIARSTVRRRLRDATFRLGAATVGGAVRRAVDAGLIPAAPGD